MKATLLEDAPQKTFAIVLDSGDEVMEVLHSFAKNEKLHAARFTAIGAFRESTTGFFDVEKKDYVRTTFHEQLEVINLSGDVAMYKDAPVVHAHVTLANRDAQAFGGHLFKGVAHPTLEIILIESPAYLKRKMDQSVGIPLIELSNVE